MAPFDPASDRLSYLKSVLDCTSDALFVTEQGPDRRPAHRIFYVNEAFTRLTGYSRHDAAGKPPTFLCTEANNPSVLDGVEAAFRQGDKATFLLLNARKDGSRFRAELFINPVSDGRGSRHVVGIHRVPAEYAAGDAAAEDRFRALADNLGEAILIYRDGQPLFANRAYVDLFGYSTAAEALREISPLMNLPLEDHAPSGASSEKQAWPDHARPVRCEALRTDGAVLRLAMRSHRVDWRGGPAVMLTIERDRRQADPGGAAGRPATHSNGRAAATPDAPDDAQLLRELMDAVPVVLAHKTRDLRYSYVNKTYADWVGLPRAQIVGHHVGEVRNEAHFQMMKGRRADVLSGNTVQYVTKCEFPGRGMCDLLTTLIPQQNADGEVVGYFSLAQDITALKEVERALLQREQQLRVVMDSVPALISYRDRNLRYHYVNRQYHEWYGVRRENMIGRHMSDFVDLERFRRLKPYIDRVLAGEHVRHTQVVDFPGVGRRKVHISFIPHEDEHGHIVGFFSLSQEIILPSESHADGDRQPGHAASERTPNIVVGGE